MNRCWPEQEEFTKIYDIRKELGEGAFGTVNLCVEKSTHTEYAVKTMNKRKLIREEKDPQLEARICGKLLHPNITRLYNVIQGDTLIYLVFELAPFGDLFDDIEKRNFYCEEDASFYMRQILDAINYCHIIGIVHRDLKPENILLASEGRSAIIKLCDFGLSIEVHDNEQDYFGVCGSEGYYAPEVLKDKKYGKPVDVFACGVILYLLLSGQDAFPDEFLNRRVSYGYGREFDQVSLEAKNLIDQMLIEKPGKRITSAEALKHPFFYGDRGRVPSEYHLASAVQNIKEFNARRKFKAAIFAVRWARHFRRTHASNQLRSSTK